MSKADKSSTPFTPSPPPGGRHYTVRWSDADGAAREHRCTAREDHVRRLRREGGWGREGEPEMKPTPVKVFRMRLEAEDGNPPGPWCWYWCECDDAGWTIGDPSEPFRTKKLAQAAAIERGFRVRFARITDRGV